MEYLLCCLLSWSPQAVAVRDLGLSSEAASLQFAFALWAEELAATVPGSGPQGGSKKEGKAEAKAGKRAASSEPAAAGGEQVATSSGKPAKKVKA
jgi:hypothetical protein